MFPGGVGAAGPGAAHPSPLHALLWSVWSHGSCCTGIWDEKLEAGSFYVLLRRSDIHPGLSVCLASSGKETHVIMEMDVEGGVGHSYGGDYGRGCFCPEAGCGDSLRARTLQGRTSVSPGMAGCLGQDCGLASGPKGVPISSGPCRLLCVAVGLLGWPQPVSGAAAP